MPLEYVKEQIQTMTPGSGKVYPVVILGLLNFSLTPWAAAFSQRLKDATSHPLYRLAAKLVEFSV